MKQVILSASLTVGLTLSSFGLAGELSESFAAKSELIADVEGDLSFSQKQELKKVLNRIDEVLSGNLENGIRVFFPKEGGFIRAVTSSGKSIIPSGWRADSYKKSNTIVTFKYRDYIYAFNREGKRLIPDRWRGGEDYQVTDGLVAFTYNDYIYAFNADGDRIIPDRWRGSNFHLSNTMIAFTYNEYIYAFNTDGKRIIPDRFRGEKIKLDDQFVEFTWRDKLYVFTRDGKRID